MTRNVGTWDRLARTLAVIPLAACAVMAPLPLFARVAAFALPALYLAATALLGACAGYAWTGRSTCATPPRGGLV